MLDNEQMEYEADTPRGKVVVVAKNSDTYEVSQG